MSQKFVKLIAAYSHKNKIHVGETFPVIQEGQFTVVLELPNKNEMFFRDCVRYVIPYEKGEWL